MAGAGAGCWTWVCGPGGGGGAGESESLSLACIGLAKLGEELRLSWSMSLVSLLPSSLALRLSELSPSPSPSDCESGPTWSLGVFMFFLSGSSVSGAPVSLCLFTPFTTDVSTFIFLLAFPATPALVSALDALVAMAEVLVLGVWPPPRTSSWEGDRPLSGLPVNLFRPLLREDIGALLRRVFIPWRPPGPSSSSRTGLNR